MGSGMIEALVATLTVVVLVVAERARREARRQHREQLIALLLASVGPAVARADGQELLGWRRVAGTLRDLLPDAVRTIERRTGQPFPFPREVVEDAHARWTADWLAWERAHDIRFRQRTSALEAELRECGEADTAAGRARLATLDDEKLQDYQRRYEEYVRVGKELAALADGGSPLRV
jgi:hypothetical protein